MAPCRAAGLAAVVLLLLVAASRAEGQAPTNLQVLPDTLSRAQVVGIMGGFTRALGVRCVHCHVEEQRDGVLHRDFASDAKPTKRVAREMMRMVMSINERLATLPQRASPPVTVQCATCHRGSVRPRMLQDTLLIAYGNGGIDTLQATYRALRERYYGTGAYDFGEVPLASVGDTLRVRRALADAALVHALNVEANPSSDFAVREHARAAVLRAFVEHGAVAGTRELRRLHERYGARGFPPATLNRVGYDLLALEMPQDAVAVFRLNVELHPTDANAPDSLGEGLLAAGDTAAALAAYRRALELNPQNANAAATVERLEGAAE